MNDDRTPQLEAMIQRKVEAGLYVNSDASEVFRDALHLTAERDDRQRLRDSLALAEDQIDRGEGIEWEPAVMERLKRQATANALRGKPIKDDVKPYIYCPAVRSKWHQLS